MPSSLNKVMLIGNLGQDAELRHTPSGTAVVEFGLATTSRFKNQAGDWQEKTDWHNVVLWYGERVSPYLKKGKKVFVEGRLQTRSWEAPDGQKRYRTEVVCNASGLMLLGGRDGQSGGAPGAYRQERVGDRPQGARPPYAAGPSTGGVQPGALDSGSAGRPGGPAGGVGPEDDDIPF